MSFENGITHPEEERRQKAAQTYRALSEQSEKIAQLEEELRKTKDNLYTAVRLREQTEANLDRYRHYICEIGRFLWGNRDAYAPDAVCRQVCQTIQELREHITHNLEARQWPDIGPDPLQQRNLVEQDEDAPRRRLSRSVDIQQQLVPDQTALVWRADLNWVSMELVWRRAGFRSMKQWIDDLVPALKSYLNSDAPFPEVPATVKKFIEIYDKKEIPGQKESEAK